MHRRRRNEFGQRVPAGMKTLCTTDRRELLVIARARRRRPSLDPDWLDKHALGPYAHLRVLIHEQSPPTGYRCAAFVRVADGWVGFLVDIAEDHYFTLRTQGSRRLRRQARSVGRDYEAGVVNLIGSGLTGELVLPNRQAPSDGR